MSLRTKLVLIGLAFGLCATPTGAAPARDSDPLIIGTVWRGKLTQRGGGPTDFECAFTITKRDGDNFEADLYEKAPGMELTYVVRGTIKLVASKEKMKSYKLEFESVEAREVKNTGVIIGVPYTATLTGRKIKGSWKDDEYKLEGDFEFEIAKE